MYPIAGKHAWVLFIAEVKSVGLLVHGPKARPTLNSCPEQVALDGMDETHVYLRVADAQKLKRKERFLM